jgi:hypothetical protein
MRAEALSRKFAAALHSDQPAAGPALYGTLVGIEHEFLVLRDGLEVDFAGVLDSLDLGPRFLDPADANARRLPSGAAITCDVKEAEIALPPVAVRPGFTREAAHRARMESLELSRRLGVGYELQGTSTHISVNIPARIQDIEAVALLYAHTFAPALMMLLDRRDSYGVWLRPRPGRLEFCGEYARGERLRAVIAFAVGSVRACVAYALGESLRIPLPPHLEVRLQPVRERAGYVVRRTAMGVDLYAHGRDARLPLASGGDTRAETHLFAAWSCALAALDGIADQDDVSAAQRMVDEHVVLPVSTIMDDEPASSGADGLSPPAFGRILQPLRRPRFDMAPVMVTWDVAVFVATPSTTTRGAAFVCVPRAAMDTFVQQLDGGSLDTLIHSYLRKRFGRRRLERRRQVFQPGLYGSLGPRRALLPREPHPAMLATSPVA